MMNLKELLSPWIQKDIPELEINDMSNDSRQVKEGGLFLAYPGTVTDGRQYIELALQQGARAVLYDPEGWHRPQSDMEKCCFPFPKLAKNLSHIANRFYDDPSQRVYLTGVTGTNGKTTIAYQLAQAHQALDSSAMYIGTLGYGRVQHLQPLANTTPDALCVNKLLHESVLMQVQEVCMEVSSHALAQNRVQGLHFEQATDCGWLIPQAEILGLIKILATSGCCTANWRRPSMPLRSPSR